MAAKAAMSDDPFMSFLPIGEIFVKFTGSFTFGGFAQFPVASRIGIGITGEVVSIGWQTAINKLPWTRRAVSLP
jgi:hypothetical protein